MYWMLRSWMDPADAFLVAGLIGAAGVWMAVYLMRRRRRRSGGVVGTLFDMGADADTSAGAVTVRSLVGLLVGFAVVGCILALWPGDPPLIVPVLALAFAFSVVADGIELVQRQKTAP
jgi:hypothetical protein